MSREEILRTLAESAVDVIKEQAIAVLRGLTEEELRPLVEAQVAQIIEALQSEIDSTSSLWVKIRNRTYIIIIRQSVDNITAAVRAGMAEIG